MHWKNRYAPKLRALLDGLRRLFCQEPEDRRLSGPLAPSDEWPIRAQRLDHARREEEGAQERRILLCVIRFSEVLPGFAKAFQNAAVVADLVGGPWCGFPSAGLVGGHDLSLGRCSQFVDELMEPPAQLALTVGERRRRKKALHRQVGAIERDLVQERNLLLVGQVFLIHWDERAELVLGVCHGAHARWATMTFVRGQEE